MDYATSSRDEELLERFLCRELPDAERPAVEKRLVTDRSFFERLLAVEADLVSAYAAGRLSGRRAVGFERHLARMPDAEQRLAVARALLEMATLENAKPAWKLLQPVRRVVHFPGAVITAAAIVLFAVGVRQLNVSRSTPPVDTGAIPARTPTATPEPPTPGPVVQALSLKPGQERGTGAVELRIAPHTSEVRLDLEFDDPSAPTEFAASLRSRDGKELLGPSLRFRVAPGTAGRVTIPVMAKDLPPDTYTLTLIPIRTGQRGRPLPDYTFIVVRE